VVALAVQRRPEASTVVRLEDRRARRRWRRGGARGWWRSAREKEDALWSFLEKKKQTSFVPLTALSLTVTHDSDVGGCEILK
jgi:hypothetical protein